MTTLHDRYTLPAILFHWLIAALIILQLALGWYMEDLPKGALKSDTFALHKSVGITVFLLALMRLRWRLAHPPPPLPPSLAPWQRGLARGTHISLYVLMFLQPLSGYLSSSFSGYQTRWFGLPLPHWGWKEPVLNEILSEVHELSAIALVTLVIVHSAAALRHALTPADTILRRMLP